MGKSSKGLTRRGFLEGFGATAGLAVVAGVAGCAPKSGSAASASSEAGAAANSGEYVIGATPSWLGQAPDIATSAIADTKETDLLIVGAGNGGTAAAATAADMGIDFLLVEKGTTVCETRNWYGAINIPECAALGKTVDTLRLNNEVRRAYCGKNDMRVVRVWIDESAEMHAWVKGIMASYGYSVNFDGDQGEGRGGVGEDMYVPPEQVNYLADNDCPDNYKKMKRNQIFEDYIGKKGHEILYNYDLAKLIIDGDGAVTGALFDTGNKSYVQINAKNVLLTAGGYAGDPFMLDALNPILSKCLTASNWWPTNTGMGIKSAMRIGAMKDPESSGMVFDRGAVPPGTKAGWTQESLKAGNPQLTGNKQFNPGTQPFLKMNTHGERFFNESADYDWAPYAAASQPGGVYIEVWDSNFASDVARFHGLGCSSLTNVMVNQMGMGTEAYLKDWIDQGIVVKADTLDALADGLGLQGDHKKAFLATVDRYNTLYDKQADPDFGKEPYLLSEIRKAPFYGVTLGGILLSTGDGLRINTDMQVLNGDAEPIKGLYAAGDCSGSVFADGYYNLTHGMACGRTLTFARHAVRHIAGSGK
jgi:fumarate reductase flavoprotein subunit